MSGCFSESRYTCADGGVDFCDRDRQRACEDIEGGFICSHCVSGTEPNAEKPLECVGMSVLLV